MKTLDEMIAVMQASKTQEIETRNLDGSGAGWTYIPGRVMRWDWDRCDYRVKVAEPKRIWVNLFQFGCGFAWSSEDMAKLRSTPTSYTCEFIELTTEVRQKLGL